VDLDYGFNDRAGAGTMFELARGNGSRGKSYKYPKLIIASNESFVRRLTCRFQTTGIGSDANRTSVMMFMTELNIPIAVKTSFEKHFAFGSPAWSQLARIGTHEKKMVCKVVSACGFLNKMQSILTYSFTRKCERDQEG
jgi:hypothetical protein